MRIAALSAVLWPDASFPSLVKELFDRAGALMDAAGLSRRTPVSWYLPEPSVTEESLGVYAGYVSSSDTPGLESVEIPGIEVASVIHRGSMEDISHAYQALARWAEAHGHAFSGTPRRKRSIFLEADGEDQTDWVVDVQLELGS